MAITALLLVRRRAPDGGFFADGDRAAGVFGVLATGFSVLLGFIVFLAFTSYDQSRSGAEQEALILVQQVENAQFLPQPAGGELTGELVCYGRSVVNAEWDADARRNAGRRDQPVGREDVSHPAGGAAAHGDRAVGLRQVARPDIRARGGAARSHPRRRRRDPDHALDRPVLHRDA